jgi:tetratricopeptide (TPR) repeat protein
MEVQSDLNKVFQNIKANNLSGAISGLEIFLSSHPHQVNSDRLHAILTELQLMADYWKRGFKDPQLPNLYQKLMQRMYVLCANISRQYIISQSSYLLSLQSKVRLSARDFSPLNIREELETFVSEIAMLELEPEHKREARQQTIYAQHQQTMDILFNYLFTSDQWIDSQATSMEDILVSPTVDSNDQQLMIGGIMLSLLEHFDMAKFRTLVHVYERSEDEYVRQRALVGWALTLDSSLAAVYPEQIELVEKLVEQEQCRRELLELQQQLIMTMNAEEDTKTIQRDIIPNLVNGQQFRMTRNGLEEAEEDPMQDILNPGESERKMEQLEESYHRMMDMQKQGSDIYFGGFALMKRYPFFTELTNWFLPFYFEHPVVSEALGKFKNSQFLQKMLTNGPFCNSDRYSFLLAFSQVMNSIPASMREIMDRGEIVVNEIALEDTQKPAYIRRIYLQDIYRFFRLFSNRDCFKRIFSSDERRYLFFKNPIFRSTHLEAYFNEMAAFLIKKKKLEEAEAVLMNYGEHRRDFQYYMMAGYLGYKPLESYARALELQPDNERAIKSYARVLFAEERYEEALGLYDRLVAIQPEKKNYLLNRAVCQTNLGRYEEAEKVLFRLNYEKPDDEEVSRVLAWTLTCDGKYEQADHLYRHLLSVEEPSEEDMLNYGYCLWFNGHVDEAADCFHRYLKETGADKEFIIENEMPLIRTKGITEPEIQMMLYIL